MPSQLRLSKKVIKKAAFWLAIIAFLIIGVMPWIYYLMAGETPSSYPIKLSKWLPPVSVPDEFIPPEEVYIKDVPYSYIPSEKREQINYSGVPAAVMVANFYGDKLSLEDVNKEVSRARWGLTSDPSGLVGFFKKRGYKAKNYGGSERDLKYHLSLGRPVVIWQFRNQTYIIDKTNSIEQAGHSFHTRVVIGYKKIQGQEYFIVHEGGNGALLDMVTKGPAPNVPSYMIPEAESLEKYKGYLPEKNKYVAEQEKLKATLPDYIKTEDIFLEGKNHFIKRADFLAMWQNLILNPFGLPFTNSPTPTKPNFTFLIYKEK